MNDLTTEQAYHSITSLLQHQRLKEAMTQLEALLTQEHSDFLLKSRLEQVKTSYYYMLNYMRQGANDPQRNRLYQQLLADVWEVADQTYLALQDLSSTCYYHELRRAKRYQSQQPDLAELREALESFTDDIAICHLMPQDKEAISKVLDKHEQNLKLLFTSTLANSQWNTKEADNATLYLQSLQLTAHDLALFVSAVTLSLLMCFDPHKTSWLLQAIAHDNAEVNQRALIGLVLVLYTHPYRFPLYPELQAQLSLLNDEGKLGLQINRIYLQLLQAKETEKIDRKMREEIIPEMMKNARFIRNMKFDLENSDEENDRNPDWTTNPNVSNLDNKLMEMNEMQMEGADIYMGSFAQLKHFPFFREISNWFMPFYKENKSIVELFGLTPSNNEQNLLSLPLQAGFFCDSDKYSLCFTMKQIPPSQRALIVSQLPKQEELKDMMDNEQLDNMRKYASRPETLSNQYIHNLYRFYKLFPRRNEWRDIFAEKLTLHTIPVLSELLDHPELQRDIADFLFRKEHYADAVNIYSQLANNRHADVDIYQRLGYCLQKDKQYPEAISAYNKADTLKPDNLWTIRHLATCHRLTRDFESALPYYAKAEAIQPENHNILFFTGVCLAETKRYAEALQYFFKLDLKEDKCTKAWRAIGWCSFMSGKYEQAARYYDKLLCTNPQPTDYLNAGHVAWVSTDIDKAINLYTQASKLSNDRGTFIDLFMKDRDTLLEHGINEKDIPLMLDQTI